MKCLKIHVYPRVSNTKRFFFRTIKLIVNTKKNVIKRSGIANIYNFFRTVTPCDIMLSLAIGSNVTITRWNKILYISFVSLFSLIVMCNITQLLLLFRESPSDITTESACDFCVTASWRFHCEVIMRLHCDELLNNTKMNSHWDIKVTNSTVRPSWAFLC